MIKQKLALVPDHFTPNKDIKSAQHGISASETFAHGNRIVANYFEVGADRYRALHFFQKKVLVVAW